MSIMFDRVQISSVNRIQLAAGSRNRGTDVNRQTAVPTRETFLYILENAKKGNEMAAVQLDEWKNTCKPQNDSEKQIVSMIQSAVNEILK